MVHSVSSDIRQPAVRHSLRQSHKSGLVKSSTGSTSSNGSDSTNRSPISVHTKLTVGMDEPASLCSSRSTTPSTTPTATQISDFARTPAWMESGATRLFAVISDRLFFTAHRSEEETVSEIGQHRQLFFFSSDLQEKFHDWNGGHGIIGLQHMLHFREFIAEHKVKAGKRAMVYYCNDDTGSKANTALLLASYLILEHGYSAERALQPFLSASGPDDVFFLDCFGKHAGLQISLRECVQSLATAVRLGWLDRGAVPAQNPEPLRTCQDVTEELLLCGMPMSAAVLGANRAHLPIQPRDYCDEFRGHGVSTVVRTSFPEAYDAAEFEGACFEHCELAAREGGQLSERGVRAFFAVMEGAAARVAVVCAEGRGEGGALAALWLMRQYGVGAVEAGAWVALCRPGSTAGADRRMLREWERRMGGGARGGEGGGCSSPRGKSILKSASQALQGPMMQGHVTQGHVTGAPVPVRRSVSFSD